MLTKYTDEVAALIISVLCIGALFLGFLFIIGVGKLTSTPNFDRAISEIHDYSQCNPDFKNVYEKLDSVEKELKTLQELIKSKTDNTKPNLIKD